MSTVSSDPANQKLAPPAMSGKWKNLAALVLLIPIVLLIVVLVPTLLAERTIETKRREIARAGGKIETKRESPAWVKLIAGDEFHSFLDRSIIDGVLFSGEKIDDAAMNSLAGLQDVRYLVLEDTRVTETGLKMISQLKGLRILNLRNTPVKDLSNLAGMPLLETMMVDFSKVRDEQFGAVAQIPNLRQLSAGSTQMSDAGLLGLSKSTSLEELNISWANLGEHGLAPLQAMKNLKVLVLEKAVFNPADLEAFKAAVPGCKVSL